MAAIHLSHAIGGDFFLGFISAVAFATILAVVSGLTLAGASAISHDLYAFVICKGKTIEKKEILVRRVDRLSKLDLFKVEKYNIPKNNGSVTKKMYIPDSL